MPIALSSSTSRRYPSIHRHPPSRQCVLSVTLHSRTCRLVVRLSRVTVGFPLKPQGIPFLKLSYSAPRSAPTASYGWSSVCSLLPGYSSSFCLYSNCPNCSLTVLTRFPPVSSGLSESSSHHMTPPRAFWLMYCAFWVTIA